MRTRWVRTALVAACALAYLVVWAGTAEAATPRQLLHRYQPVTVLDPLEQFAPTEVNGFVDDSVLEMQTAPGVWSVDGEPDVGDAANAAGTELHRCRPGGQLLPAEPGGLLAGRWHRRRGLLPRRGAGG